MTKPALTDIPQATIEADPRVPAIKITRDFRATPKQLIRAHTDPKLVAQWMGPLDRQMEIDQWDARTGGNWRYVDRTDGEELGFHGCFHEISEARIVQTFTFEGFSEAVALETMWFEVLDDATPASAPSPSPRPSRAGTRGLPAGWRRA